MRRWTRTDEAESLQKESSCHGSILLIGLLISCDDCSGMHPERWVISIYLKAGLSVVQERKLDQKSLLLLTVQVGFTLE